MSEFVRYLHEVFIEFGAIRSRKMFGGHGLYHQDRMFGLVADDQLYLKVDKQTQSTFESAGLEAFQYIKNNKPFNMSYHQAPDSIFDDPEQARYWATLAFEAALRAASKKSSKEPLQKH